MLFLLTVVLVALKWGRGPAVLAAFVSVATFDFFFVPPRFSFAVSDIQYLLTFAVMLAVALIIGQMTAGLRYQARVASYREERARVLYEFAREMSSKLLTADVVESATRIIANTIRAKVAILVPDEQDRIQSAGREQALAIDIGAAQWAYDKAQPAGAGTDTLAGSEFLYLPLRAPMRTRGVLVIKPDSPRLLLVPEQRRHLDTFAALTAIALERVHYVEVAQQALISMESERLRNSLLSTLSHDLRTPLAALVGLAESLALTRPPLSPEQLESANAIAEEARRMSALVNNLLEMARIESGEVKLRRQWHPFEEVVGSALKAAQPALADHRVELDLARDLPLVEFDATLIERVLYNLIENACKYTPAGTLVTIAASVSAGNLLVSVSDTGPGIPKGQEESIFEKFTRGTRESSTPGVGLGLAISRAIVEAHHGKIWAENGPNGGARFSFTLPLGTPPDTPEESAARAISRGNAMIDAMSELAPVALLIEDERQIRRFVRTALETEGWQIVEAETIKQGLIDAGTRKPDVVILDLGLPDGNGIDFIRDFRTWSPIPIIVLSARTGETDKIEALDAGADDYLTKPFSVGELLARVRATRRRSAGVASEESVPFRIGDVEVDLTRRTVRKGDAPLHLTPIEFRLLALMIKNVGRVLTHRQILREVWGPAYVEHEHYVRVHMGHLRQKVEDDPAQPKHLITETAVGYRLVV